MKDRQPTQVLSNGAIRYGVYNADGTLDHYEYLKREDAPAVEGTPLNKANLLSDATAAKLWPNAATRPEDPTVNDALGKLSEGTAKVGDIAITARTDLSDAWLPCDGRTVSQEQYPSLCAVLRTPDSPAIWTEKTVSTNIGAGGDALSYENGHWFRTYRDATSAHILVSDNGETWTEWPIPQNFWANSSILSSRVVAAHAVKYCGGLYVCSVLVSCVTSSGSVYKWGILFANELFAQLQADSPSQDLFYYTDRLNEFQRSCNDVFFDGTFFFVLGVEDDGYNPRRYTLRYTSQPTSKAEPAGNDSQAWNKGADFLSGDAASDAEVLSMYVRKTDGMIMIWVAYHTKSDVYYNENIWYAKSVTEAALKNIYCDSSRERLPKCGEPFEANGNVYWTAVIYETYASTTGYVKKVTGANTLTVETVKESIQYVDYAMNCNGQIVGAKESTVCVSEDIEQGWDYTTVLGTVAENQPATAGTVARVPCSSNGATVKDILHNFAFDNKKIPSITPDARSHAYIKALEE